MRIWFPKVGTISTVDGRCQQAIGTKYETGSVAPPPPITYTNYMRRYLNDPENPLIDSSNDFVPNDPSPKLSASTLRYFRRYLNDPESGS
jgi:hypothetical protein